MVTLVFTMQAAGLIVGPALAAGLLVTGLSHDHGLAHPARGGRRAGDVRFWMRRHMAETPRYLLATGQHDAFGEAASHVLGQIDGQGPERPRRRPAGPVREPFWQGFRTLISNPAFLIRLVGASLAWACMDFAYYGNTVSSPMVLAAMSPNKSLLSHTLMQLAIFAIAAAPGYLIAAATMDRIGRKRDSDGRLRHDGGRVRADRAHSRRRAPRAAVPHHLWRELFLHRVRADSTTFVYPAEIFPVRARTTGHGIAAATGKLGGFLGVFLFPIFLAWHGLLAAEGAAAIVSVLGAIVTLTMLPETKGKSLEELSPEEEAAAGA